MKNPFFRLAISFFGFLLTLSCQDTKSSNQKEKEITTEVTVQSEKLQERSENKEIKEQEPFKLNEENAISFFYDYEKTLTENKVKLTTSMGSFTIELFENVPYHRANFIFLAKKGYFDNTMFHRVVKNFIIQGGNADNQQTAKKRSEIGRYLLPPDTRKGHQHHRGVISMPSSDRDNPHKLASPYEFFIVVTQPGSYHLDGDYTAFGKVIDGMDVVDRINNVEVDAGDWPMQNVYILKAEAF